MRSRSIMVLAILLLTAHVGRAEEFGSLSITAQSEPAGNPKHGYAEYRVSITNRSTEESYDVTLQLPKSGTGFDTDYVRRVVRTVTVGPSSTVSVSLLVPPVFLSSDLITVLIDGREQDAFVAPIRSAAGHGRTRSYASSHLAGGIHSSSSSFAFPFVLVSRQISNDFMDKAHEALFPVSPYGRASTSMPGSGRILPSPSPGGTGSGTQSDCQIVRSDQDIGQWSTLWAGYSSYDGLVLTTQDMRELPPGLATAIWQYIESGGSLVVIGNWQPPASWAEYKVARPGTLDAYYLGFGECLIQPERDFTKWSVDEWVQMRDAWRRSGRPWMRIYSVANANGAFEVIEDLGIPVTGLVVIMVIFMVAIGPLNIWILHRMDKLIWLLWTVPVFSLFTCFAVFAYSVIAEGWRGHLRIESLTVLNEKTHRAATIGWAGYYAPMTPSNGLEFSYDSVLTPQLGDEASSGHRSGYRTEGTNTGRSVDWTNAQKFTAGWLQARVPAHFTVRKNEVRRERVQVRRGPDGSISIVNSLGVPIEQIYLADGDGKIYRALNEIGAGASEPLVQTPNPAVGALHDIREVFANDWIISVVWNGKDAVDNNFSRNPAKYLRPNTYIAVLNASPFLEDGLDNPRQAHRRSIVYGILGDESNGN